MRKIIVILLGEKMCSRVVTCSKNANQIAVSHPFDTCDDSQLLKSLPSMHANVSVPTTTEGWVEKKKHLHYLFTITDALSLQRRTPLAYFE